MANNKRKGVAGKGTKPKTKVARTYSPASRQKASSSKNVITNSRDKETRKQGSEDNSDGQDEGTEEEENNTQDGGFTRLLEQEVINIEREERYRYCGQDDDLARFSEQEERNIEREREKKEKERRERERERESRERERRERERREKDKEQAENENNENVYEEEIPFQFGAMTNQLQICNWLVLHPNVLHLANQMLAASSTSPSSNSSLTTSLTPISLPADNDNYRLIDEEMKCLFLRTRNPPDHAFDKLTQKIFGHDAYQSVAKSTIERYRKSFADYRYQLKNVLSTLVKEFQQIAEREATESSNPTDVEVNNFITRKVVLKRILSRQVSAIDFTKLSETSLEKLVEFSREYFKIVYSETESVIIKKRVMELDVLTEGLEIPSRSGRNIASSLKLRFFPQM